QAPTPLQGQSIAGHFNHDLAKQLQWQDDELADWQAYCSGHKTFSNFPSLAMVYAGHQFGHWAGQLGDGRGLLMAQVQDIQGNIVDLHLKGAGKTPYSRMGDGRAVLRSVIREYLAGHALNALGVASSNAIGFTTSEQRIQRERSERGAMLLRTADSHIRLGHFEWIAQYRPELLAEFTQQCIAWYYPHCLTEDIPILAFARAVIQRTAHMIAQWQLVGFAHGVMNTDNLNITGSTLDFGPFMFMERFRPAMIFNHSDHQGRYVYQNQPSIAHWNLWTWLNTLIPLAPASMSKTQFQQLLLDALEHFEDDFLHVYQTGLAKKMGLPDFHHDSFDCGLAFLRILSIEQLDYTQSFLLLQQQQFDDLRQQCLDLRAFDDFYQQYQHIRTNQDCDALQQQMQQHNPRYILRNHMAQRAIEQAEQLDFSEVARLFELLKHPFQAQPEQETAKDLAPLPKGEIEVAISCSS
ncbi:MAG: YdiU family protein, partial [Acinetobacter sp.]|nr:YdiU family protein [Acinetobacter sp.]